jgi:hypothetical protein
MFVRFVSIKSNSKPVWAQHAPRLAVCIYERETGKNREKSFFFAGCLRRNALNRSSVSRFCLMVPSRNSRKTVLQWQERENK